MSKTITITAQDVQNHIKFSCKVPEVINEIVLNKIITASALEMGISVENEELQKAANQFRSSHKLRSANLTWSWLEKHSLSLDDFEEMIHNNLLSNKLANALFAEKVESYFIEHQLDYCGVVMYEIILDDEDLALELFYAISENETNFYDAAHQYNQDSELRRKCGYRGIVNRHDLKSEVSAAIFAAKPPQVLKPIITSKGVHLILVEEIIQPQLDEQLRYQILLNLFSQWTKQQIEQIEVIKSFGSVTDE